ncbi:RWD-domain-containing protein [Thozetella sp. PMI_491]|nr:RWD-domain-containing protein [Thozetella sp. PMI_491]
MDSPDPEDLDDDPRHTELSSLEAIYPEIQRVNEDDPYTIALELPVNPTKAVVVFFPATADAAAPAVRVDAGPNGPEAAAEGVANAAQVDSHELAYLPSVHLEISLGAAYPAEQPPTVTISTRPPWIPPETARRLEGDAARLWEDMGRDIVVFTYIDHIQQSSEDVFGLVGEKGGLEINPSHKIAILDYDIEAKRMAFEKETFDCGVCLDPKKGSVCHRMLDCGHVFCTECLQDFYNNAIKEGDLASVRCLAPNCAKERVKAAESTGKKRKQPRMFYISPSELLQIPLESDVVKRYVALKYKTELESDKNTIYCPRSWCNGAARSKKHKKPEGFELAEHVSDDESEREEEQDATGDGQTTYKPFQPTQDLLAICEDCGFAFCSRCFQSWHGEFYRCRPRDNKDQLTEEDKASLEYMKLHTTPCPTCAAPVQKTHGCNHMICYRCQSHFCYLCSAWLNPSNPYQHFNETTGGKRTSCYQRLWELEGGDGDDVGIDFAGGGRAQQPAVRPLAAIQGPPIIEIEEGEDSDGDEEAREPAQGPAGAANDGQVGVAREGPLVLRIAGGHRPAARDPEPPRRQHAGQQPGGRGQAAARGQGRGGRARARGRAGRAGGDGRRGGVARDGAVRRVFGGPGEQEGDGAMNPAEEAWVRQFVRLALNDEEDLLFDLGDDLDPDFIIEEGEDSSSDEDEDDDA